jgi:hypothetical protein
MKKTCKITIISVSILMILSFITGCKEEVKNDKQARLVAQKQAQKIKSMDVKHKEQVELLNKDIVAQKDLLAQCEKKNATLKVQVNKGAEGFMEMITEMTKSLREENAVLKAKIAELEKNKAGQ